MEVQLNRVSVHLRLVIDVFQQYMCTSYSVAKQGRDMFFILFLCIKLKNCIYVLFIIKTPLTVKKCFPSCFDNCYVSFFLYENLFYFADFFFRKLKKRNCQEMFNNYNSIVFRLPEFYV